MKNLLTLSLAALAAVLIVPAANAIPGEVLGENVMSVLEALPQDYGTGSGGFEYIEEDSDYHAEEFDPGSGGEGESVDVKSITDLG